MYCWWIKLLIISSVGLTIMEWWFLFQFQLRHKTKLCNVGKELIICFNKKVNAEDIPSLCINGNNIERVNTFKLLCVSSDLSWDYHVMYLRRKVAKRMYCINYLLQASVPASDIVCVYTSIIRSVLEYACPVWHSGLTKKQYWVCTKTLFKTVVSGPFINTESLVNVALNV